MNSRLERHQVHLRGLYHLVFLRFLGVQGRELRPQLLREQFHNGFLLTVGFASEAEVKLP